MSRDDGFAVMDVSTDLVNDPKVRKLFRHAPDHAACAFLAYIATVAESWKAGRRVNVDDAWPGFVPFDKAAIEALAAVGLLDKTGRVTVKAWRGWYVAANQRRLKSRERWARYNAHRDGDTTDPPRGSDGPTATSVPPVLPSSPSGPTGSSVPPARARGEKHDGSKSPTKEEALLTASADFQAGKLTELDYQRLRKALTG
jgi:hypothetical protein